jgi:sucrose-6-phosphate hydrolase SacC (GH32 family)
MVQAKAAVEGELAATALVGAQQLDAVLPQLIAIENNLAGAKGSWMFLDACDKIAVFVTQAGKSASGAMIYFAGTVDVKSGKLVDTANVLADYGIDFRKINTLEDMETALRSRGFSRMVPAAVPMLYQTLNMALSFIKSLGGSAIQILVVPGIMLTPEELNPYCGHEMDCIGGPQT